MDLSAITEIADYMEREIGIEISPRQPFVGRHFNVTRAGIHADGMLKDEEIYNIFDIHRHPQPPRHRGRGLPQRPGRRGPLDEWLFPPEG